MNLNRTKIIITIVAVAILTLSAVFLLKNGGMGVIQQKGSGANTPEPSAIQSTYTHASPKFSFEYPKGFSAGSFPEGQDSETLLVHGASGENSMQILISPFDEDIVLTKKRILKDAPDTEIKNEKEITIGKTARGLQFQSSNSSGPTTEVWFVHKSNLYQISLPAARLQDLRLPVRGTQTGGQATGKDRPWGAEDMLSDIITTWKWDGTK